MVEWYCEHDWKGGGPMIVLPLLHHDTHSDGHAGTVLYLGHMQQCKLVAHAQLVLAHGLHVHLTHRRKDLAGGTRGVDTMPPYSNTQP